VVLAEIRRSNESPQMSGPARPACTRNPFPRWGIGKAVDARLTSYWKATGERPKAVHQSWQLRNFVAAGDGVPIDGDGVFVCQMGGPTEIIIPSAIVKTVRTTNFKVTALWVIADTRFDLPHAINATFYRVGELETGHAKAPET
jgi:hypothetical protein